jgi:uncharacterized protein YehS (DUF1456 family)
MNNNDILIRLRYALDIKDTDMIEIFKLGGIVVSEEEVAKILVKQKDNYFNKDEKDDIEEKEDILTCSNYMLESFLNGFIIYKRGIKETDTENQTPPAFYMNNRNINNILLKKLKIALGLSSDDMLDILKEAGVIITKGELSAVFRKEGHKNYKECGERYSRNFLKGLAIRYRNN